MIHSIILRTLCLLSVVVMVVPLLSGQGSSEKNPAGDRAATYNLYFGDLHSHTSYSDAWEGTPWDAYKAAKEGGADYFALTDHVALWNAYGGLAMDEEEWADTLAAADYYTSKNFVALAGYEAWLLGRLGEINVFNVRELPVDKLQCKFDRLPDFYDWLASKGGIGQWNHPYYMTNDFEGYDYYTPARDGAMNMIEVWNDQYTEDSYVMALDAGWHVMPTVNSDTHNPDWISGYEMRTVLLANSLTPGDLYGAMNACRGYGTLDKNLRVYYTLDGAIMGSTLPSADGTYTASIKISDADGAKDKITLVEVVASGGQVVASIPTNSNSVDLTVQLDSQDAKYFYVRVTTASSLEGAPGVTAWTAPVWTGR